MISVILPVYNCEQYIAQCIESVLNQTYDNFELVIVNDGSNDNTLNICSQYANQDNRIILINQINKGVAEARNVAIRHANGEYITFIDSDDFYHKSTLDTLIKLSSRYNADFIYANYYEIRDDRLNTSFSGTESIIEFSNPERFTAYLLFQEKIHTVWRCFIKKEIAKKIEFKSIRFAEDLFYILEVVQQTKKSIVSNQPVYYYRRNKFSMTQNSRNKKYIRDYKEIPFLMNAFLERYGYTDKLYLRKLTHEYAYAAIRLKKILKYKEFVNEMNDCEFRSGIKNTVWDTKDLVKSTLTFLVRNKIYFPFMLIKIQSQKYS